jgi:hypothetical protein
MEGSATLTTDVSRKSRRPTAQRKTRRIFPCRVARNEAAAGAGDGAVMAFTCLVIV